MLKVTNGLYQKGFRPYSPDCVFLVGAALSSNKQPRLRFAGQYEIRQPLHHSPTPTSPPPLPCPPPPTQLHPHPRPPPSSPRYRSRTLHFPIPYPRLPLLFFPSLPPPPTLVPGRSNCGTQIIISINSSVTANGAFVTIFLSGHDIFA